MMLASRERPQLHVVHKPILIFPPPRPQATPGTLPDGASAPAQRPLRRLRIWLLLANVAGWIVFIAIARELLVLPF